MDENDDHNTDIIIIITDDDTDMDDDDDDDFAGVCESNDNYTTQTNFGTRKKYTRKNKSNMIQSL